MGAGWPSCHVGGTCIEVTRPVRALSGAYLCSALWGNPVLVDMGRGQQRYGNFISGNSHDSIRQCSRLCVAFRCLAVHRVRFAAGESKVGPIAGRKEGVQGVRSRAGNGCARRGSGKEPEELGHY